MAAPSGPAGDFGIGLCAACCQEHAAGQRKVMPMFAVTWVVVAPGVTLPSCYEHIRALIEQASKPPLAVARGGLSGG